MNPELLPQSVGTQASRRVLQQASVGPAIQQ